MKATQTSSQHELFWSFKGASSIFPESNLLFLFKDGPLHLGSVSATLLSLFLAEYRAFTKKLFANKNGDMVAEEDYKEPSISLDIEGTKYHEQNAYGSPILPTHKQLHL